MKNAIKCIEKRLDVMFTCYNGGDGAHWNQVQSRLKGMDSCIRCLVDNNNQCTP
ncbi:hypothetical protein [Undibacterium curvum]|uniref:hypothetical protein n=1 Tax=Undibacterium curvum TaxID=2762294 RepID=UPI003D0AD3F2